MTTTARQNNLILAEDWKRVYQTFKNADFKSYDFENLRRVMISYLRENYPEDFNDYIESSEYLALIDLVAFLGQSLAFRIDLASRENFIELAERKESVLRLARMLAYNAKRNVGASGLLKFDTVSTTESILDGNGKDLSRQTIVWNDSTNSNWYEQFIKVLNSAMTTNTEFGKSQGSGLIDGFSTEQYRLNSINTDIPIFTFNKLVSSRTSTFEVVSTVFKDSETVYEETPFPGTQLGFIYRTDGRGSASANTGFYFLFKEGSLELADFSISQPVPNEKVSIDAQNINNDDVWLYSLDANGKEQDLWTSVSSLTGNNIAYNSIKNNIKNIYAVITKANDYIDLAFSDGVFGNLPQGPFRCYYRISNGLSYTINPADMRGITISVPYLNKLGVIHTLTISMSLKTSVSNSAPSEDLDSIRTKAPAMFYTQNRMVTGEDYNLAPLSASQNILKVKAINRTSSGISRNFDIIDATGKYSKVNVFADDGLIYKKDNESSMIFTFANKNDVLNFVRNKINPLFTAKETYNFYLSKYDKIFFPEATETDGISWIQVTNDVNLSTGYFINRSDSRPINVGAYTSNNLQFAEVGTLIKFIAPPNKAFKNGKIVDFNAADSTQTRKIWSQIVSITGDGSNGGKGALANGLGPIKFNDTIPTGAYAVQVVPKFVNKLSTVLESEIVNLAIATKNFGLRFDISTRTWKIISESNLDLTSNFSLARAGDIGGRNVDSSWIVCFVFNGNQALVRSRSTEYVFESLEQNRFYFDSSQKIFDSRTKKVIKDQVKVLGVNSSPTGTGQMVTDIPFELVGSIVYDDGYESSSSVRTAFFDSDDDGIIDNPDAFEDVVGTNVENNKYLFFREVVDFSGGKFLEYIPNINSTFILLDTEIGKNPISYSDRQLIYFYNSNENVVKRVNLSTGTFDLEPAYSAFVGRSDLKFQYIHNANVDRRIDPSVSNIVDIYLLTRNYDTLYRQYLAAGIDSIPSAPTSDELRISYGSELDKIKTVSDEIVYHHARYKVLFGGVAEDKFQVRFKVVKNPSKTINDNELKVNIISSINQFFSVENWDFGDTFYYTELAAYVVEQNSPNISNMVIVPKQSNQVFGSLFEIKSRPDEIFVNGAIVDDIDIVTEINAAQLNATGTVITSTSIQ
ncbi:hypothetical protein EBU71_01330 [bacterium]|nr:hypothetical protein [Candidatus Elulimicrobium humile]